ncbi:MAG: hypothetical protein FK733_08070 [Asgard group archaeon]|nr:hypothetical protein [Asgard group archaeon]
MAYRDRTTLNRTILIVSVSIIVIVTASVLITNAVVGQWGTYEILTGIGTAFAIIGGLFVYATYAGGIAVSNTTLHAQAPEVALAENEYARKRRLKIPWVGLILIAIGAVFLGIGLSRI